MKLKGPAGMGLIIIVILLAAGLGFFIFSEKQDPANQPLVPVPGWQIYQNQEHGFEFLYPESFTLQVGANDDNLGGVPNLTLYKVRPERVIQAVDCGGFIKEADEIGMGIAVALPDSPGYATVAERYEAEDYKDEPIGGKQVRTRRNVPGMCEDSDRLIWKAPNGWFVIFIVGPSNTELVAEYSKIIETFRITR